MNRCKISACKAGKWRGRGLTAIFLAPLFHAFVTFADDAVDDQTILASVNVPAQNLSCDEAAAQASVSFKALNVPFEVRRVSVFIDGAGLPESAVDESWPTMVVNQGLHPGRNLVEFILYGPDNQSMDRKQTVLIGIAPGYGDVAPAQIECSGAISEDDAAAPPALAVDESSAPDSDATQPFYDQDPAYADGPIYSYYPAPVFFGPVYSVGYFGPPPVYYSPRPPLFYYGHRGPGGDRRPNRGGVYGRPGEPERGPEDGGRRSVPAFGDGASGHPGTVTAPTAHHGTFNMYAPPSYGRNDAANSFNGRPAPAPENRGASNEASLPQAAGPRTFGSAPVYGPRPQTQNVPRELPPPSRQLAPPQQLPLPSNRFSAPPPAPRGGAQPQQPRR